VLLIIRKNKDKIKEDQLLRAKGLGDTRETNPNCYDFRKRYHKLYYYFKPGKQYWIFYIILRKFWIAFAALIFRSNPTFQLAFILLILFVSYAMQVRNKPYMSKVEARSIVDHMKDKAEAEGNSRTQEIVSNVENVERKKARADRRIKMQQFKGANVDAAVAKQEIIDEAKEYFFDYNTVEATLLGCAILVCLAGIMFESGHFTGRDDLSWQRDLITYLTILVIFFSILYYVVVVVSEISGSGLARTCCPCFFSKRYKKDEHDRMFDDGEVAYEMNPMRSDTHLNDKLKEQVKEEETKNQILRENIKLAKQIATRGAGEARAAPHMKSSIKKKKEFRATSHLSMQSQHGEGVRPGLQNQLSFYSLRPGDLEQTEVPSKGSSKRRLINK